MATAENTDQVQADKPAKAPKERKPRTPKDLRDFGPDPTPVPGYKLPAELPQDKTGLRQVIRASGLMNAKAASYMTPKEIKAALRNEFPFTMSENAFGTAVPAAVVKNLKDAYKVAGDRKVAYTADEKVRAEARDAERKDALGELSERFPGRTKEARIARLKATLEAQAPWVPVTTEAARADGRVYDVDGQAGRKTFYTIAPQSQLKNDGTPKANAPTRLMSPQVYEDLIKGDKELEALVVVPDGFNVAVKKERAPKPAGDAKPRKKRQSNSDALAAADEAVGMPGADSTENVDDAIGGNPAPEVEIPTL